MWLEFLFDATLASLHTRSIGRSIPLQDPTFHTALTNITTSSTNGLTEREQNIVKMGRMNECCICVFSVFSVFSVCVCVCVSVSECKRVWEMRKSCVDVEMLTFRSVGSLSRCMIGMESSIIQTKTNQKNQYIVWNERESRWRSVSENDITYHLPTRLHHRRCDR
jgi:hypothetical protein